MLFTGKVILLLWLEFICLLHRTSKFFSPLLRVWLWGWGACFEVWCPIFLFFKKFYFRQSLSDAMKVKLISFGNQAMGPQGTDIYRCSILSSLCPVPSARAGLLLPWGGSVSPLLWWSQTLWALLGDVPLQPHPKYKEPGNFLCTTHH